jgi:flagellar hook assembly protein FlgD
VGQTAAGAVTGPSYRALIGFWQPEGQTGVREAQWFGGQVLKTRLDRPMPNPARTRVAIRYTLDAQRQTLLQMHDLTGRVVRTLCASSQRRGAYNVTWNGTDDRGRELARGVYFCRFSAGDYRATEKLVLQR